MSLSINPPQPLAVVLSAAMVAVPGALHAAAANPAGIDWVRIGNGAAAFDIARTETTVGQFRRFVQATGTVTRAERAGGGEVYEAGWTHKPGWVWSAPFGVPAGQRNPTHDDEPAVHVGFDEAQDRKSTRLNSSHVSESRMPSSA